MMDKYSYIRNWISKNPEKAIGGIIFYFLIMHPHVMRITNLKNVLGLSGAEKPLTTKEKIDAKTMAMLQQAEDMMSSIG